MQEPGGETHPLDVRVEEVALSLGRGEGISETLRTRVNHLFGNLRQGGQKSAEVSAVSTKLRKELTVLTRARIAPSPRAGKMYKLFPCPGS